MAHAFAQWSGDELCTQISATRQRTTLWDRESVLSHVVREDWGAKNNSPYISTSLSFFWAIWFVMTGADRCQLTEDMMCISIIQLAYFDQDPDSLATAAAYLNENSGESKQKSAWNFATQSQEVLIYGRIPKEAVVGTVSLKELRGGLPSWMNLEMLDKVHRTYFSEYYGCLRKGQPKWNTAKEYAEKWAQKMREEPEKDLPRTVISITLTLLDDPLVPVDYLREMAKYLLRLPFRSMPLQTQPQTQYDIKGGAAKVSCVWNIFVSPNSQEAVLPSTVMPEDRFASRVEALARVKQITEEMQLASQALMMRWTRFNKGSEGQTRRTVLPGGVPAVTAQSGRFFPKDALQGMNDVMSKMAVLIAECAEGIEAALGLAEERKSEIEEEEIDALAGRIEASVVIADG